MSKLHKLDRLSETNEISKAFSTSGTERLAALFNTTDKTLDESLLCHIISNFRQKFLTF